MRKIIKEVLYPFDLFGKRGDIVSAEGLPYLGSKGRLFDWILRTIEDDRGIGSKVGIPFCGGGSDTIGFARNGYRVKANDLNKGIVDLLERVTRGDKEPLEFAKHFITRAKFEELRTDDWRGAFAKTYYSFRSIGENYVYTDKQVEEHLMALWQAAVWGGEENIKKWQKIAGTYGYAPVNGVPTAIWLQENFGTVPMLFYALQMSKFELDEPDKVEWLKGDYQDHDWSDCELLYCDPPYRCEEKRLETMYRTTIGGVGGFDHKRFWDWAIEQGQSKDVYVSEQNAPKSKWVKVLSRREKGVSLTTYNTGRKYRYEYLLKIKNQIPSISR